MPKILFVGHSHINALRDAHAQAGGGADREFLWAGAPEFRPEVQEGALNPALAARIAEAEAGLHVSLFGGNDHSIIAMLNHPQKFDFVLPEAPELPVDDGAEFLPAGLLLAELERRVAPHLQALAALRGLVSGPVVHVESPPPVPSAAHIEKHPGVFRDKIAECGVSPALFRYKMWRLHSSLYRAACARLGITFLAAPAEMQDEAGMMIEPTWNPDPTHGNARYGAAVLAKLEQELA